MNFDLPEPHARARDRARDLGLSAVAPTAALRDRERSWDPAIIRALAAGGLLGAPLPVEYGGGGCTALEALLLQEGFGRGSEDAGVALAWGVHTFLCGVPISRLGTPEQRQRYLPPMCRGDWMGGFAGSDRTAIETRAVLRGDRWLLTGTKAWVTNGPVGHHFLVTASTISGLSLFIVERDFPGFHVGRTIDTLGLRTARISELRFEDCEVPHENLLGEPGCATSVARPLIARWERSCLLGHWLGLMQAAFERCAQRVRERHQFGRPIAQFQAVRTILADMKIRHSLTRWTAYRAAVGIDTGAEHADRHCAAAKLHLCQAAQQTMHAAIELHGAEGLLEGESVERAYRDVAALGMLAGSSDLLRSVIAGSLLSLG